MSKKRTCLIGDSLVRIITVRGAITSGLLDAYLKQKTKLLPSVYCAAVILV